MPEVQQGRMRMLDRGSDMKIVYNMSIDDEVAINSYYITHRPSYRRSQILWGVFFPLGLFVFFLLLHLKDGELGGVIIPGVIVPGMYALWIFAGKKKRIDKAVRKTLEEGTNRLDGGEQELEVTSEGLSGKSEFGESKFKWKAIESTVSTPDYYFIFIGAAKSLVVPKLKVTEGDFEEFRRLVEEGFRGAATADGIDGRTFDESKIVVDDKPAYRSDSGRKSCSCGVVSLVGGVLAVALYGVVVGMAIVAGVSAQSEEAVEAPSSGGYLIMAAIAANLVGVIYGVAGLIKANQKKLLPIIGVVINCGVVFLIGMLLVVSFIFA